MSLSTRIAAGQRINALQKELESYGSVRKLREVGGVYRPELDGNRWNTAEYTGNYLYRTGPGSVNPYSYPCRHVRASDLWCRRRRDVIFSQYIKICDDGVDEKSVGIIIKVCQFYRWLFCVNVLHNHCRI